MAESTRTMEREWRELADATAAAPFLAPEWIGAWVDSFGRDGLRVHTVRRAGRLVGVAPLRRHRRGAIISTANWHTPLWAPLALDDAAARALARSIHADRPHRIELRCLDADLSSSQHFLRELRALGYRPLPERHARLSPTALLESDWESFSQRLGRRRRAEIRRAEARLAELGEVRIELHRGGADLDAKLREGLQIESSGWKGRSQSAIASAEDTGAFYARLAHRTAERGMLNLLFLRLDERAIAFSFNLEHDGTLYGLRMAYDEEYRSQGPGILMMKAAVTTGVERGLRCIDFGGNLETDAFKREWSDGTRRVVTSSWLAPTPRGRIEHGARATAWAAKRSIAQMLTEDRVERLRSIRSGLAARLARG